LHADCITVLECATCVIQNRAYSVDSWK